MQCEPPRPRPSSEPADGDHLDTRLAQAGVGVDVAVVGDDDAWLEAQQVVAVVPLLALALERVAAGGDDPHVVDAERVLEGVDHAAAENARRPVARASSPGRIDQTRAPSTTSGNSVTASRSTIVITVSRCM